jgi:hypothetical protein
MSRTTPRHHDLAVIKRRLDELTSSQDELTSLVNGLQATYDEQHAAAIIDGIPPPAQPPELAEHRAALDGIQKAIAVLRLQLPAAEMEDRARAAEKLLARRAAELDANRRSEETRIVAFLTAAMVSYPESPQNIMEAAMLAKDACERHVRPPSIPNLSCYVSDLAALMPGASPAERAEQAERRLIDIERSVPETDFSALQEQAFVNLEKLRQP